MLTKEERYNHDPMFRTLVDTLFAEIMKSNFTPTEIREAAMLAQIRYEFYHPLESFIYTDPPPTDRDT